MYITTVVGGWEQRATLRVACSVAPGDVMVPDVSHPIGLLTQCWDAKPRVAMVLFCPFPLHPVAFGRRTPIAKICLTPPPDKRRETGIVPVVLVHAFSMCDWQHAT